MIISVKTKPITPQRKTIKQPITPNKDDPVPDLAVIPSPIQHIGIMNSDDAIAHDASHNTRFQ